MAHAAVVHTHQSAYVTLALNRATTQANVTHHTALTQMPNQTHTRSVLVDGDVLHRMP